MLARILPIALGVTFAAHAAMDDVSRDALINKLSKVQLSLPQADQSKVAVTLRLADLLAERARLASLKELDSGCVKCTAGKADREKAIRLYQEALPQVEMAKRASVQLQLGHLLEMNGRTSEAVAVYQTVVRQGDDLQTSAEAHLSLAEHHFRARSFAQAERHYEEVIKVPTASSKGLAAYRIAWCFLNTGREVEARNQLIRILKDPNLLSRTEAGKVDLQFQEEVSRDLATVMARTSANEQDFTDLLELSPEPVRLSHVRVLARESERLGRSEQALSAWTFYGHRQADPHKRFEAQVHRVPLLFAKGDRLGTLKELESALALGMESDVFKGNGVEDENRRTIRQLILGWNKTEKKSPSTELIQAYGLYLKMWPKDFEMAAWAAQAAREKKDWAGAFAFHEIELAALRGEATVDQKRFDQALLLKLEAAEAMAEPEMLKLAQDEYLAQSPFKTRAFEVRYQQIRSLYDRGELRSSADSFRAYAQDVKAPEALRLQSANLALDALAQLKDSETIANWSQDFARQFPKIKRDFDYVGQKALITKSAAQAEDGRFEEAWATLALVNGSLADPKDRILALRNKVILAEKMQKFGEGRQAAEELLILPQLEAEDKDLALSRLAFFAEMQFDFAAALKATEKLQKVRDQEARLLKLALYADLSGQGGAPYYSEYLKASKSDENRLLVAVEMVRRSGSQPEAIAKYRSVLSSNAEILGRLWAEAYVKSQLAPKVLSLALGDKAIEKTGWARIFKRAALLDRYEALKPTITSMNLSSATQKSLNQSIKNRMKKLDEVDALAKSAIELGDWTSQVLALDLVAKESERFYQELMSLPLPSGLTPEQESEYLSALSQQASPFKAKADQALAKVGEFWGQINWKSDVASSLNQNSDLSALVMREIRVLTSVAAQDHKDYLASLKPPTFEKIDLAEVEQLKAELRQRPFDQAALERLLGFERKAQNFAMVTYLEGRIESLKNNEVKP